MRTSPQTLNGNRRTLSLQLDRSRANRDEERGSVKLSANWSWLDIQKMNIKSFVGNYVMHKVKINFHVFVMCAKNSITHLFLYFTHNLRHVLHDATNRKVGNHLKNKDYLEWKNYDLLYVIFIIIWKFSSCHYYMCMILDLTH